jgi:hypothetical protein
MIVDAYSYYDVLSQAIILTCRRVLKNPVCAAVVEPCRVCYFWIAENGVTVRSSQREQPPVGVFTHGNAGIGIRPDIEGGETERQPLSQAALQKIVVPVVSVEGSELDGSG